MLRMTPFSGNEAPTGKNGAGHLRESLLGSLEARWPLKFAARCVHMNVCACVHMHSCTCGLQVKEQNVVICSLTAQPLFLEM